MLAEGNGQRGGAVNKVDGDLPGWLQRVGVQGVWSDVNIIYIAKKATMGIAAFFTV
jgi:hypothetical protein